MWAYAAQGYRSCGAADGYAYRLGNVLVGNDPGAAVLECTLRGAALRFETDTVFALTGAESPAALDSTPVSYYAPLLAKAGSVLQMGAAKTGLRSYLAVGGGIATPARAGQLRHRCKMRHRRLGGPQADRGRYPGHRLM